ncbi:hypothetical protein RJ639_011468 [Escallonia herrerae]|uniref:DUF4216 domain-containing protein n=1 Tax=Escallonia herrerae TaxID=1293975 RepID=A0AA89AR86_9ASTE|nr:hypothetical protein RJ639_011468 [Escallonia herrerae]
MPHSLQTPCNLSSSESLVSRTIRLFKSTTGTVGNELVPSPSVGMAGELKSLRVRVTTTMTPVTNKAIIPSTDLAGEAMIRVLELYLAGDERISEELRILARGPNEVVTRYKGFIINGFRFHIKELEQNRKTQNSGLVVNAMTPSFSSARDDNPILGDLTYYGVLEEIIELQYSGSKRVVLFRSNWVSKGSRKKEDENGFTLLNFKRLTRHKEPFVLASQVQQVFYTEDVGGWHVVIKTTARDAFDMNAVASEDDVETYLQSEPCNAQEHDRDEDVSWVREGVQGTIINMN